jgi:hypothetical protein
MSWDSRQTVDRGRGESATLAACSAASSHSFVIVACAPSDGGDDTSTGSSGGETTGEPGGEPQVRFAGKVDVVDLCGVQGANVVSFRASKVGCATAGPCTIKTDPYQQFIGDAATCPSGQASLDMKVRVPDAAKYQVEARTLTDSGYLTRCYGVEWQAATLTVTADDIAAREHGLRGGTLGGPCPNP